MNYKYQALTRTGRVISGDVEALSPGKVKEYLLNEGLTLLSFSHAFPKFRFKFNKTLKNRTLMDFFTDFGTLKNTGMTDKDCLATIVSTTPDRAMIKIAEKISDSLEKGYSLSDSMRQAGTFPEMTVSAISSGEKAGALAQTMIDLGRFYKRKEAFIDEIKKNAMYPVVVFVFAIILLSFVGLYTLPKLAPLFENLTSLPFVTRAVLGISGFARHFWYAAVMLLVGLGIFIWYFLQTGKGVEIISRFYEKTKLGRIFKEITFSTIFLNLSTLTKSGVSLIEAISLVSKSTSHYITTYLARVRDLLGKGYNLSKALEEQRVFGVFITSTVKKGETSGELGRYLQEISDFYYNKTSGNLDTMARMVEPMLLVGVAGIILFVALSFIIPIYGNLGTFAQPK